MVCDDVVLGMTLNCVHSPSDLRCKCQQPLLFALAVRGTTCEAPEKCNCKMSTANDEEGSLTLVVSLVPLDELHRGDMGLRVVTIPRKLVTNEVE